MIICKDSKIIAKINNFYKNLIISEPLTNDYSLGFVNFNHHNANNDLLLKYAIESFKKYNKINDSNILIIQDNDKKFNIKYNDDYINYDYTDYEPAFKDLQYIDIDLSHCLKIDLLTHLCKTKYLILCDCDIIFKNSLDKYLKQLTEYDVIGTIEQNRIVPFLLLLNIESIRDKGFLFSNISGFLRGKYTNTGSNLLQNINLFKFNEINIYDIIWHYGAASQKTRLDKEYNVYYGQIQYIHDDIKEMTLEDFINLYDNKKEKSE